MESNSELSAADRILARVGKGPSLEEALKESAAAAKAPSRISQILGKDAPVQQRYTKARRRKERREISEKALREGIKRIKEARRTAPKEWERAYNSAIGQIEIFLDEILAKQWAPAEL